VKEGEITIFLFTENYENEKKKEKKKIMKSFWGGCLFDLNFGEVSYVYGKFLKDYVDSIMREWWLILVNYNL
jgi:hypothetical protein